MGGGPHDRRSTPIVVRPEPVLRGDAPAVARKQARKPVLGHGCRQVVADGALVLKKFGGHHRADRVQTAVLVTGGTAAVPVEASHGLVAARFQWATQHVAIRQAITHPLSIALSATNVG